VNREGKPVKNFLPNMARCSCRYPQRAVPENNVHFSIVKTPSGKPIYAHASGSVGGTSQLIVYPDSHVVVALVTNVSGGTGKEVKAVAEAFESIKK
jgi:hypothetical protein